MWLINVRTLQLEDHLPGKIPKYAILSHTWDGDEPSMQEWQAGRAHSRQGYTKVKRFADLVADQNVVDHIWVDTCCIDKKSSAELSEAINSMFAWYRDSYVCYAYLSDVDLTTGSSRSPEEGVTANPRSNFEDSRWFTRGWCLQELLAPRRVVLFDRNWELVGRREDLHCQIQRVTDIDSKVLRQHKDISDYSVAQRMSWASKRQTTRPEDIAYCLLGIFEVNMPLLYGEGDRAFSRLQEEILRQIEDPSIFAWSHDLHDWAIGAPKSCLASSPAAFADARDIVPFAKSRDSRPFTLTNRGIQASLIELPATCSPHTFVFECGKLGSAYGVAVSFDQSRNSPDTFVRLEFPIIHVGMPRSANRREVYMSTDPKDYLHLSGNYWLHVHYATSMPMNGYLLVELKGVHPSGDWCLSDESLRLRKNGGVSALRFHIISFNVTLLIYSPRAGSPQSDQRYKLVAEADGATPPEQLARRWRRSVETLPIRKPFYHILRSVPSDDDDIAIVIKTQIIWDGQDRGLHDADSARLTFLCHALPVARFKSSSSLHKQQNYLSEAMLWSWFSHELVDIKTEPLRWMREEDYLGAD